MTSINAGEFYIEWLDNDLYPLIQELRQIYSHVHSFLINRGDNQFLHNGTEIQDYLSVRESYLTAKPDIEAASHFYNFKKPAVMEVNRAKLGFPEDEMVLFENEFFARKQALENLLPRSRILSAVYSNPANWPVFTR